jgi:AAA15 family ATPase/GTPase
MQPPHISQIHIENFKCFKKLDIPEFKQINLIGGKNNVGKTALLEVIELLYQAVKPLNLAYYIQNMLIRRQYINSDQEIVELDFIYNGTNYLSIESNYRKFLIKLEENESISDDIEDSYGLYFSISVDKESKSIPAAHFLQEQFSPMFLHRYLTPKNIYKISPSKIDDLKLSLLYGTLVDINKEGFLDNSLAIFDENLVAIKQRAVEGGVVLKIQKKDREHPVLLSSLGDGVNRYIAILCAIWASQDGILLIDEIENGIHYTNYPKLWDLIFKVAKEANCQLFITSHSKECIEAFNRVQLDNNDEHSLYLELFKSKKDGLIKSFSREPEQLGYALAHEGNIRGE